MHARLRRDLTAALRSRDEVAVAALRSALAAVDNAGARPATDRPSHTTEHVAGAARGVGSTEVERRPLTEAELRGIVEAEVAERSAAAREYDRLGRPERAGRLRAEADLLRRYLRHPG